jgi:hypothetical protein
VSLFTKLKHVSVGEASTPAGFWRATIAVKVEYMIFLLEVLDHAMAGKVVAQRMLYMASFANWLPG